MNFPEDREKRKNMVLFSNKEGMEQNMTVCDRGGSCKYFIDLRSEKQKMEQKWRRAAADREM